MHRDPERNENPSERQRSTIDPKQGSTWRPLCNTDCQHADGLKQRAKEALRKFDELTGNSLNKEGGAQTGKEKKKGFMDKIKESFDEH